MKYEISAINSMFPSVAAGVLAKAREAKKPLNTAIGRAIVGNGFFTLQKYAAHEANISDVAAYIAIGRYICNEEAQADLTEMALDIERKLMHFSATSGSLKTCGISAWKKYLSNELPCETYIAPKKQINTVEMVFSEPVKKLSSSRTECNYRDMTPEEKMKQAAQLRVKMAKMLDTIERLEASAEDETEA